MFAKFKALYELKGRLVGALRSAGVTQQPVNDVAGHWVIISIEDSALTAQGAQSPCPPLLMLLQEYAAWGMPCCR